MTVVDILASASKPLFTCELVPPLKGRTIKQVYDTIDALLCYEPAYINFTYHREEAVYRERPDGLVERHIVRRRPGTVALSAAVRYKYGIEVVPHLLCGGFTAEETEEALIELNFLGIENVFALRGDPPRGEKRFAPHPNGHSHTTELVKQIADMNKGVYLDPDLKEPFPTRFCIGVAGYPEKHCEAPNMEEDILWLKMKVDNGADYIVTQMFFINQTYFNFVEACRAAGITVPIIPGIKPITAKSDIDLLPHTFNIDLPRELVRDVKACTTKAQVRAVGVDFAVQQSKELIAYGVPGIHYYTLGKPTSTARIVEQVF